MHRCTIHRLSARTKLQVCLFHCLCCPVVLDDDAHVVAGCPGTDSVDCGLVASRPLAWCRTEARQASDCLAIRLALDAFSASGCVADPSFYEDAAALRHWNGSSRYCDVEHGGWSWTHLHPMPLVYHDAQRRLRPFIIGFFVISGALLFLGHWLLPANCLLLGHCLFLN